MTSDNCTFTHCDVTERQDAYTESILDEYISKSWQRRIRPILVSYLQAINANEGDEVLNSSISLSLRASS